MSTMIPDVPRFRSTWWRRPAYLFEEHPVLVAVGSLVDFFGTLDGARMDAYFRTHEARDWLNEQYVGLSATLSSFPSIMESLLLELDEDRVGLEDRRRMLEALRSPVPAYRPSSTTRPATLGPTPHAHARTTP